MENCACSVNFCAVVVSLLFLQWNWKELKRLYYLRMTWDSENKPGNSHIPKSSALSPVCPGCINPMSSGKKNQKRIMRNITNPIQGCSLNGATCPILSCSTYSHRSTNSRIENLLVKSESSKDHRKKKTITIRNQYATKKKIKEGK